MDLANSSHKNLIEQTIKENHKYPGNEDLLGAFSSDVYKKSYLLLDSVSNVDNLKNYLEKVVDTSISNILRQNSREDGPRTPKKNIDILETSEIKHQILEESSISEENFDFAIKNIKEPQPDVINLRDGLSKIKSLGDIYADIADPACEYGEQKINENAVQRLLAIVYELNSKYPEKKYFEIFYARYVKYKRQAKLASELDISQGELSKRHFELVRLIKEKL